MRMDVATIFPAMFDGFLGLSIVKRAQEKRIIQVNILNLRDFTHDRHRSVDDRPYGGGAGMVMKPEPIFKAVESVRTDRCHIIILSPQGQVFSQAKAKELTRHSHLIFVCGHYEGIDERVSTGLGDEEISIGDYILTNGNLAAMIVIDAVVRLLPGVLGCENSILDESFAEGLLEYPQYTRPEVYRKMAVPEVLLSGDHKLIQRWRSEQAQQRTLRRRPGFRSISRAILIKVNEIRSSKLAPEVV